MAAALVLALLSASGSLCAHCEPHLVRHNYLAWFLLGAGHRSTQHAQTNTTDRRSGDNLSGALRIDGGVATDAGDDLDDAGVHIAACGLHYRVDHSLDPA